ncbi:prepilin peptidase [Patescibacteria group bacterium]|nr:MAG: prepilin peptidase [Patescibacteria group bacterium]
MIETILYSLLFFIFGSAVGSFLNVVVLRAPKRKSIVKDRSHCPKCKHSLGAWDLIPVWSFLFLRERCRYCKRKISWQYPLVEAVTGIIFVLGFLVLGISPKFFFFMVYASFLIAIFVLDYTKYIIPDFLSVPAMIVALFGSIILAAFNIGPFLFLEIFSFSAFSALLGNLGVAILIGGGFFLAQFLISRGRWVGGGDIRLGVVMGLMLGFPVIIAALGISYVMGALWSIGLMILKRRTIKDVLPFGTFLTISAIICLLWGEEIVIVYLKFIGF